MSTPEAQAPQPAAAGGADGHAYGRADGNTEGRADIQAEGQLEQQRPLDPAKLLRMASMVREVLDEVRRMQPNPDTAQDLAALYGRVKAQIEEALPQFLATELDSMELDLPLRDPFTADDIRVAYSGMIGWLGGLFQGLQASFQQAQAQQTPEMMQQAQPELMMGESDQGLPPKEGYL
jgi:hypothetical protein